MKKISLVLLFSIILLSVCGCGNTKKQDEEISFNLTCVDSQQYNDDIIVETYTNTLVLPKDTTFLKNDILIKSAYYCYDTDTQKGIEDDDISIDTSEVNINEVGTYNVKVKGKYENKIGTTEIPVKVVESCSGNCTINTSNWTFEIIDNKKYVNINNRYNILNVQVKMTPTDNAFPLSTSQITYYSDLLHGFIKLRENNGTFFSSYVADSKNDATIQETDNALAQSYIRNKNQNTTTYLKFRVVPIIESEAYIDFYDKVKDEHHFYYLHN